MTTILLVDDDPLEAAIRKSALEKRFYNVHRVVDPADAFCMVEQPHFAGDLSLVIADLHRPGIDGPEFVAEMHARLPGVPMLVLGPPEELSANQTEAAVRFLSGHVAPEEMLTAASQMIAWERISSRIQ